MILFFCVLNLQANQLPFKEATIHYKITGNTYGKQTTYIRNYGEERVTYIETHSKIMHPDSKDRQLIMITPEWTYHINLITQEGTREPTLFKKDDILLNSAVKILGYKKEVTVTSIKKGVVDDTLFTLPKGLNLVEKNAETDL